MIVNEAAAPCAALWTSAPVEWGLGGCTGAFFELKESLRPLSRPGVFLGAQTRKAGSSLAPLHQRRPTCPPDSHSPFLFTRAWEALEARVCAGGGASFCPRRMLSESSPSPAFCSPPFLMAFALTPTPSLSQTCFFSLRLSPLNTEMRLRACFSGRVLS